MYSSALLLCFIALISTTIAANIGTNTDPLSLLTSASSNAKQLLQIKPTASVTGSTKPLDQINKQVNGILGAIPGTQINPSDQLTSSLPGVAGKLQAVPVQTVPKAVTAAAQQAIPQQVINSASDGQQQLQNMGNTVAQAAEQQAQQLAQLPQQLAHIPRHLLKKIQHYVFPQRDGTYVFGITDPVSSGIVYTKNQELVEMYMEAALKVKQMQSQLNQQLANMSNFAQQIAQYEDQPQQTRYGYKQNMQAGYGNRAPPHKRHHHGNRHGANHYTEESDYEQ